jgi:hypothetical protein
MRESVPLVVSNFLYLFICLSEGGVVLVCEDRRWDAWGFSDSSSCVINKI